MLLHWESPVALACALLPICWVYYQVIGVI